MPERTLRRFEVDDVMTRSLVLRALALALIFAGVGCNERRHATRRSRARGAQPTALAASTPPPVAAPAPPVAPAAATARPPVSTVPATTPPASGVAGPAGTKGLAAPAGAMAAAHPSPAGAAGAAGATPPEMAVVILMLPGARDPAHPGGATATSNGAPLTYKVSLAPGAQSATIELEGRPPVIAPVQRVYPSPSPPVSPSGMALLRAVPAAAPAKIPPRATPAPGWAGDAPVLPRARTLAPPSSPPSWNSPANDATALADPRGSRISRRVIPTSTRPLPGPEIEFTSANGAPIIE